MKRIILCLFLFSSIIGTLNSQNLIDDIESIDPVITWPWNWDIISNQNQLITVNENGTLNIKVDGLWNIIEVDLNGESVEPRGVAIGQDSSIWFTTTEHGLWNYTQENELVNYNSSNSFLPIDNLRSIAIDNNIFWISTDGLGLIRHDFDSDETIVFTSEEYEDLKSNFFLDPYLDESGNVWFRNREFLSSISPQLEWTNEDMRFYISGGRVNDIHIESESEIWLAMDGGVVLYDGTDYNVIIENQFDYYGQVLKDSRGDVWLSVSSTLNEDGMIVMRDEQEYFFSRDNFGNLPSQVFEMVEHKDTVMVVGTIGNNVTKLIFEGSNSTDINVFQGIEIFPNPTSSTISFNTDSNENVLYWSLSDMNGKKVMKGKSSYNEIDVSGLSSGVYVLNLILEKGEVFHKITVSNNP